MDEAAVLAFIARLKSSRRNLLPADDIGLLPGSGRFYAATDSMVENTHYRDPWLGPGDIAYKLFARNWSDFLCKGIRPESALLNLSLRRRPDAEEFTKKFLRSLDALLSRYGITLVGGDATRAEHDHFTLSFFGRQGKFIPRAAQNLRAGDLVLQLGAVGASDAARAVLMEQPEYREKVTLGFRRPHLFQQLPAFAQLLASIDQSDSVAKSLLLLAQANRAELHVELSQLQVAPAYSSLCSNKPGLLPAAAEDLAVFALARATRGTTRGPHSNRSAAFRPVGQVKTIRAKKPCVRYFWHEEEILPRVDEFEHF
ncbi:MAG TPA: AIR synthase related protein [Turneriella sp.]|nr:AIR synthase related protein [Turneriella sp.]